MRLISKKIKMSITLLLATTMIFVSTDVSAAQDLTGLSSVKNYVLLEDRTPVETTIMTHFHSSVIEGLVGISSRAEFNDAVGLTEVQKEKWGEPIIYVANPECGPKAYDAIKIAADSAGALIGPTIALQLFKAADGYNQSMKEITQPVKFVVAIPIGLRDPLRDFAMVRLHEDGQATILPDLDTDNNTLTFETDRFSIFTMVFGITGAFDAYKKIEVAPAPVITPTPIVVPAL